MLATDGASSDDDRAAVAAATEFWCTVTIGRTKHSKGEKESGGTPGSRRRRRWQPAMLWRAKGGAGQVGRNRYGETREILQQGGEIESVRQRR